MTDTTRSKGPSRDYVNFVELPVDFILSDGKGELTIPLWLRVMSVIFHAARPVSYDEVGRALGVDRNQVKRACAKLSREHLVFRDNGKVIREPEGLPDVPEDRLHNYAGLVSNSKARTARDIVVPLKVRASKTPASDLDSLWNRLKFLKMTRDEVNKLLQGKFLTYDNLKTWAFIPETAKKNGILDQKLERSPLPPVELVGAVVLLAVLNYEGEIDHPARFVNGLLRDWAKDDSLFKKTMKAHSKTFATRMKYDPITVLIKPPSEDENQPELESDFETHTRIRQERSQYIKDALHPTPYVVPPIVEEDLDGLFDA